jgi:hypothetical protein
MKHALMLVLVSFLLASGCTDNAQRLPAQNWKNITITIETRPPTLQKGMNEFLVIANEDQRRVADNLVVTLQIKGQEKRHQAIQDGHVGVYRRAISVNDPKNDVLIVTIQRGEEIGFLEFRLNEQAPAKL